MIEGAGIVASVGLCNVDRIDNGIVKKCLRKVLSAVFERASGRAHNLNKIGYGE